MGGRTDMQKCVTTLPFVVRIFSDCDRIMAELLSNCGLNYINDHISHYDCGNTSLDVSKRSKLA